MASNHSHGEGDWDALRGIPFMVSAPPHQDHHRMAHHPYAQAFKVQHPTAYQQHLYVESIEAFAPALAHYPDKHDIPYDNYAGQLANSYPTPSRSPLMDPQLQEDDEMSSVSRLSPPHSDHAPMYSQASMALHPPQGNILPWDLASPGGAASAHFTLSHHNHGVVSPNHMQTYSDTTPMQAFALPTTTVDHASYPTMLHSPSHALAPAQHPYNVSSPSGQLPLPAMESAPSTPEADDEDLPSEADASDDPDFDPNESKRSSGRKPGHASRQKAARRSKGPAGSRRKPSISSPTDLTLAAEGRHQKHGRRSSGGTSSVGARRGRNSIDASPSNNSYKKESSAARRYICPLAPYGCGATFGAKNEWRRHVSTQHVKLGVFRCPLCPSPVGNNASVAMTDQQGGVVTYTTDFNRKDLFTQHVRRMHIPNIWPEFANPEIQDDERVNTARRAIARTTEAKARGDLPSGGGKTPLIELSPAAERALQELVLKGWVEVRRPPSSCICPLCPLPASSPSASAVDGQDKDHKTPTESRPKSKVFSGSNAWESRMDHLATHLAPARRGPAPTVPSPDKWARDASLEEWLVEQKLIEVDEQTQVWKCCGVRGNGHC
jgi:hypothetical protein